MKTYPRYLSDSDATEALGADLAQILLSEGLVSPDSPWQVHLRGSLGAGKTTLTRGVLRAMGHHGAVKSPTYTLLESYALYPLGADTPIPVYHFDLYRLQDAEELEMVGFRDIMAERRALCLLEWPERGEGYIGDPDLVVELKALEEARIAIVSAGSSRGAQVQAKFDP